MDSFNTSNMLVKLLFEFILLIFLLSVDFIYAGIPATEEFFHAQKLDHLAPGGSRGLWTQRYYTYGKHFKGPGHPIFLILGGEGGISPKAGILYPFVADHLAKTFGGYVIEPEHRFYGESQPLKTPKVNEIANYTIVKNTTDHYQEEDPRVKLFTSEQALHDAMVLLDHIRTDLGCSSRKNNVVGATASSPLYCPVIAVGGSYPGFLAAFARILFPDMVDMAYAASAPMGFYAQETDKFAYYNHITAVAEETLPGCSKAVKSTLSEVQNSILQRQSIEDLKAIASEVGICKGSIPEYIFDGNFAAGVQSTTMANELMMVVGYTFANDNMRSYPPSRDTRLHKACQTFMTEDLSPTEKVRNFLVQRLQPNTSMGAETSSFIRVSSSKKAKTCWKMTDQLPTGPNATISGGDWSGDGTGPDAESWDFQTCTLLVEAIGFSEDHSMFPPRDWNLSWLRDHCQKRFGVEPKPYELVRRFRFGSGDLASTNTTRILFTNGLKDGWSVGGIKTNLSDSLIALNFENGAHHSDLSHLGPNPMDTSDITEGYKTVTRLLGEWLREGTNFVRASA